MIYNPILDIRFIISVILQTPQKKIFVS